MNLPPSIVCPPLEAPSFNQVVLDPKTTAKDLTKLELTRASHLNWNDLKAWWRNSCNQIFENPEGKFEWKLRMNQPTTGYVGTINGVKIAVLLFEAGSETRLVGKIATAAVATPLQRTRAGFL